VTAAVSDRSCLPDAPRREGARPMVTPKRPARSCDGVTPAGRTASCLTGATQSDHRPATRMGRRMCAPAPRRAAPHAHRSRRGRQDQARTRGRHRTHARVRDGVAFVDLGPVQDPEAGLHHIRVRSTFARGAGRNMSGARPVPAKTGRFCWFGQLRAGAAGAAGVAALMASCPNLTLLVTAGRRCACAGSTSCPCSRSRCPCWQSWTTELKW